MTEVKLRIDGSKAPVSIVREIADVIKRFPGDSPVYLEVVGTDADKTLLLHQKVDYSAEFYLAVRELGTDLQIR